MHIQELGGNDPAIVFEDANIEKTVKEIIAGAFSYNGQRCTAIKRVVANEKIVDSLVAALKIAVEKLVVLKDKIVFKK
jgi:glyceraldehyde-3-phosphate dehydrogenase (NADP+)